jgi:hypothetical protein
MLKMRGSRTHNGSILKCLTRRTKAERQGGILTREESRRHRPKALQHNKVPE